MDQTMQGCGYRCGALPECAPLATSRVPFQSFPERLYEGGEALTRGTLFPGLDLPLANRGNTTNPAAGTPAGDMMALDFLTKELQLYLDTHPEDTEAFALLQDGLALSKKAKAVYTRLYGPLCLEDMAEAKSYTWPENPWPWQYREGGEA
ncbi:MAG: spore coat protein CotJB [bacterium]